MYCIGVVQYEAFIRQNETELIDSNNLIQQVTKLYSSGIHVR